MRASRSVGVEGILVGFQLGELLSILTDADLTFIDDVKSLTDLCG